MRSHLDFVNRTGPRTCPKECLRSAHPLSVCQRGLSKIGHIHFRRVSHHLSMCWFPELLPKVTWSDSGRKKNCISAKLTFSVPKSSLTLAGHPPALITASMKHPAISHCWSCMPQAILCSWKIHLYIHLFQFQMASAYHSHLRATQS